jgi:Exonuclease
MASALMRPVVENDCRIRDTADMAYSLEQMARSLTESGDYRVTSRLEPQAEYHPPDSSPKLVAAVADVETTGTNPHRDKIIELGICLFEYDHQNGRIYRVLGSWVWLEDPGFSIPPEITSITGITDELVAGHRIDDRAVDDLLGRGVLVIAHNASFDRRFLEKRLPTFVTKHWACSRADIDWRPRVSVHLRSNSSPMPSVSSTTVIGLRAIVGPPSMRWHNPSPAQGGWLCRLSWNRRDCRHGGYGRGTQPSRRRMFSRPAVTPGVPESSGDRNAGIAMRRMPIRRQRRRGSEQM